MPTELPMMAASASGLSMTRLPPKRRWRSSVTRKTPPSTPTSSPMTNTSGSRSISSSSARFSALTMFSFAMRRAPSVFHDVDDGARHRGRNHGEGGDAQENQPEPVEPIEVGMAGRQAGAHEPEED